MLHCMFNMSLFMPFSIQILHLCIVSYILKFKCFYQATVLFGKMSILLSNTLWLLAVFITDIITTVKFSWLPSWILQLLTGRFAHYFSQLGLYEHVICDNHSSPLHEGQLNYQIKHFHLYTVYTSPINLFTASTIVHILQQY